MMKMNSFQNPARQGILPNVFRNPFNLIHEMLTHTQDDNRVFRGVQISTQRMIIFLCIFFCSPTLYAQDSQNFSEKFENAISVDKDTYERIRQGYTGSIVICSPCNCETGDFSCMVCGRGGCSTSSGPCNEEMCKKSHCLLFPHHSCPPKK